MINKASMIKKNERELLTSLANKIVKHGLGVPAIFFLEMVKYMSFIGSQLMVFLGPIITVFIQTDNYYKLSNLLENKENVEYLICSVEKILYGQKGASRENE